MVDLVTLATRIGQDMKARALVGHTHSIGQVNGLSDALTGVSSTANTYTDQQVAAQAWKVQDLSTADLNTATTVRTWYAQALNSVATPARHYPVAEAGTAELLPYSASNAARVIQQYTTWQSLRVFRRSLYNGVWSDWSEQPTRAELDALATSVGEVGDLDAAYAAYIAEIGA